MKLFLVPLPLAPETNHLLSPATADIILHTDHYLVENLRTARRFISSLNTDRNIEDLHFYLLDKKTTEAQLKSYFKKIPDTADVAVMSEAGSPGIADPGAAAVAYAHSHKIQVIALPGPSSIMLALAGSGMNGQSFTFHGYLPINKELRAKKINQMEQDASRNGTTQIFMETPYRNNPLIADLLRLLSPTARLCFAADLTGEAEFLQTRGVKEWRTKVPDLHKLPCIFLIAFPEKEKPKKVFTK